MCILSIYLQLWYFPKIEIPAECSVVGTWAAGSREHAAPAEQRGQLRVPAPAPAPAAPGGQRAGHRGARGQGDRGETGHGAAEQVGGWL